jgi:hypothetical protein
MLGRLGRNEVTCFLAVSESLECDFEVTRHFAIVETGDVYARGANLHLSMSTSSIQAWSGAKVHLNTDKLMENPFLVVLECILAPE